MNPIARPEGATVEAQADRTLIHLAGRTHHLPADVGSVWPWLDGDRTPAQIAEALAWTEPAGQRRVWAALDLLGDLNLLQQRFAPPAAAMPTFGHTGLNRREALQRIAAGFAGGLAVAVAARTAFAQGNERVREEKAKLAPAELKRLSEEGEKQIKNYDTRIAEQDQKIAASDQCERERKQLSEAAAKDKQCLDSSKVREEHVKLRAQREKVKVQEKNYKTDLQQESAQKR